jgi:hypothetical protein
VPAIVKPVVILDLEELEALGGLVGADVSLIEILERKTSELWLQRDFKAMVISDFAHRWDEQPKFIVQEYGRAATAIKRAVAVARGKRETSE